MDNATYNHVLGPTTVARDYRRRVETVHKTSQKLYIIRGSHICIYNIYIYIYILSYLYISGGASGTKRSKMMSAMLHDPGFSDWFFVSLYIQLVCLCRGAAEGALYCRVFHSRSQRRLCARASDDEVKQTIGAVFTLSSPLLVDDVCRIVRPRQLLYECVCTCACMCVLNRGISFLCIQLHVTIRDDLLSPRSFN